MTITSLNMVIYTFMFLVPGYITDEIISAIMPSKQHSDNVHLLRCMAYSVFDISLWYWLIVIVIEKIPEECAFYWLMLALVLILGGFISGVVIGVVRCNGVLEKLLVLCHVHMENSIPTAWDYKFTHVNGGRWVIVRLKDGLVYRGLFYSDSFAGSDPDNRDIYIQELYTTNDKGDWNRVEKTDGVWISINEIETIEFKGEIVDEQK